MLVRSITTVLIIIAMVPILIFSDTWLFPVIIAACSVVGVFEMLGCVGMRKKYFASVPACLVAVLLPLTVRIYTNQIACLLTVSAVMFALLVYLLSLSVFSKGKISVDEAAVLFSTTAYIVVSFTCVVLLRDIPNGILVLIVAIGGPWASDVLAYLSGRFFGKHKLIPEVSPKKTVEGSIGAIVGTGILFAVFALCVDKFVDGVGADCFWMFFAGLIVSVVSQIGDLIFSAIKRRYGIKDYGKIFPGHGGILDRFDSVLAVVPVLLMLYALPRIFEMFV